MLASETAIKTEWYKPNQKVKGPSFQSIRIRIRLLYANVWAWEGGPIYQYLMLHTPDHILPQNATKVYIIYGCVF